jgi:hypothetical protein
MLVGHWPLIGNTNDYSGYNNNATNFGATVSTAIGKIGSSYQFNGTSHYMTVNNPVKAATNWTISFWFRRNGSFSWSDILTFDTGVDSTAARIEQSGSVTNQYFWFVETGFPSGSILWVTAGDNIWEHITLVVNDTTARSFKNGVLQYSYTKNTNPLPSSNLINIGRRLTSQYLGMYLNDLRIYDHALSDYEVKELAKSKILHYTFEDGTGGTDVSGLANNGTLYSGATVVSSTNRKIGSSSTEFNGTGGFYTSPMTLETYTIAFWANRDAENKMPIGSNGATLNTTFYWYGDNSWSYTHGGVRKEYYYPKTDSIPIGTWGHYAVTYDGASVKIYRNGKYEGAQATTGSAVFNPGISIGFGYNGSSFFYDGKLDDARVYATALSDADILNLYTRRGNFDNLGNVSASELINPFDEAFLMNQAIINKTFTNGISSFTQSNMQVTLTDDGVRLYRPPNLVHPTNGNTMWGGLVLLLPENLKTVGRSYVLRFKIKGQTSVNLYDNRFAFAVGWTDFGVGLTGHSITRTTLQNLAGVTLPDYIQSLWKYTVNSNRLQNPRWTLSMTAGSNTVQYVNKHPSALNIINGSTLLNNSFFPNGTTVTSVTSNVGFTTSNNATQTGQAVLFSNTQYDTYRELKFGFGYENTGVLGTDLYIKDLEIFDVTNGEIRQIDSNGIIMYYDIDEVTGTQNTNAKQEITNNGTLFINGEFSEVD